MINRELYERLFAVTKGNVTIHKDDEPLSYEIKGTSAQLFTKTTRKPIVLATDWGETYTVNCPICGDTRQRLVISHASGCVISKSSVLSTSSTISVPILMKCFNEDCTKKNLFKIMDWLKGNFKPLNITKTKPQLQKSLDIIKGIDKKELPKLYPITQDIFTEVEYYYINKMRGWTIDELNKHNCNYIKRGAPYGDGVKEREIFENRLFIPIIQGKSLVSWQARVLRPTDKSFKYKYIFPAKCRKTSYVYNMDKALFYKDIVICEGITDVWKIGDHAVALFGKYLSENQMTIIQKIWGFDGQAVIMLDSDAINEAVKLKRKLEKNKIFPRGVSIVKLPEGDPDDLTPNQLKELETQARRQIDGK